MCDSLKTLSGSGSGSDDADEDEGSSDVVHEVRIQVGKEGDIHISTTAARINSDDNHQSTKIVDTTLGLAAQAIGSVVTITLTTASSPWALYLVVLSIIVGLCFTYAAMSLRRKHPDLSVVMAKIGAVATALAIIISVASRLPPLLALTVAPFALLIISAAVAFA